MYSEALVVIVQEDEIKGINCLKQTLRKAKCGQSYETLTHQRIEDFVI